MNLKKKSLNYIKPNFSIQRKNYVNIKGDVVEEYSVTKKDFFFLISGKNQFTKKYVNPKPILLKFVQRKY